MDYGMMRASMRRLLTLVPLDFVATLAGAIVTHKKVLKDNFEAIVDELKPHIRAGILEGGTGIFDMEEFEAEIRKFLAEDFGMTADMLASLEDEKPAGT
jgi:hypothetical protein